MLTRAVLLLWSCQLLVSSANILYRSERSADLCYGTIKEKGWYGGSHVVKEFKQDNAEQCGKSCCDNENCKIWIWRSHDNMCHFKDDNDPTWHTSPGHWSAKRNYNPCYCTIEENGWYGGSHVVKEFKEDDALQCGNSCCGNEKCKIWVWRSHDNMCHLKDDNDPTWHSSPGHWSAKRNDNIECLASSTVTTTPSTTPTPSCPPTPTCPTAQELTTLESSTPEPTTLKPTTQDLTECPICPTVPETTVCPICPTISKATTVEETTSETTTLETTTLKLTTTELTTTTKPTTMCPICPTMTCATTHESTTPEPTTKESTTQEPTTTEPTTPEPTTPVPTTPEPTTPEPTTPEPSTTESTTPKSTTLEPTTTESTTAPTCPPVPPNSCTTGRQCAKRKGKCIGIGAQVPENAQILSWCNKKKGCICYKV